MIGHGLFASEPIGNLFLSVRGNIWNSKVVLYNKTTCLLRRGCFNRDLSKMLNGLQVFSFRVTCECQAMFKKSDKTKLKNLAKQSDNQRMAHQSFLVLKNYEQKNNCKWPYLNLKVLHIFFTLTFFS